MSAPKIDLMIIGAQKAGTTSLKNYLAKHARISTHPQLEFTYFQLPEEYDKGFEYSFSRYYKNYNDKVILAKNAGMHIRPEAISKLKAHNPDVIVVFILRDPVKRAISAYEMGLRDGWINQPLSSLYKELDNKHGHLYYWMIKMGHYYDQYRELEKRLGKNSIHTVLFSDLKNNPKTVCNNILSLFDLDHYVEGLEFDVHNGATQVRNKNINSFLNLFRDEHSIVKRSVRKLLPYETYLKLTSKVQSMNREPARKIEVDDVIIEYISEYFKEMKSELSDYLDRDLSHWH